MRAKNLSGNHLVGLKSAHSTSVVERAAQAAYDRAFLKYAPEDVDRWDDLVADNSPAADSWREVALAVFESIDVDELARILQREFGSFLAHDPHNPQKFWSIPARAVKAWLTGGAR